MKITRKTIFVVIGVVLGLALIIFLLSRIPKREFNTFEFPDTMVAENHTTNENADTIAMVILNKLMGYDTMEIMVFPMPAIMEKDDKTEWIAMITQFPYQKQRYNIFIKQDAGVGKLKMAFSHEMIHLKQHELGILETFPHDNTIYVWKGDTIKASDVKYEDRPHEKEAFREGPQLNRELNKILYKKRQR